MRMSHLMIMGALLASATAATTAEPLAADEMGLSKTSVFDTPTPDAFAYTTDEPRKSSMLPRAYGGFEGAPPQIPHAIDDFMPITAGNNACAGCHDRPHLIGREYRKGATPPIPRSHYGGFKGDGDEKTLSGANYVCSQCHVPQSGAEPLVVNTRD